MTLEPGGQLELSGAPWRSFSDIRREIEDHLAEVRRDFARDSLAGGRVPALRDARPGALDAQGPLCRDEGVAGPARAPGPGHDADDRHGAGEPRLERRGGPRFQGPRRHRRLAHRQRHVREQPHRLRAQFRLAGLPLPGLARDRRRPLRVAGADAAAGLGLSPLCGVGAGRAHALRPQRHRLRGCAAADLPQLAHHRQDGERREGAAHALALGGLPEHPLSRSAGQARARASRRRHGAAAAPLCASRPLGWTALRRGRAAGRGRADVQVVVRPAGRVPGHGGEERARSQGARRRHRAGARPRPPPDRQGGPQGMARGVRKGRSRAPGSAFGYRSSGRTLAERVRDAYEASGGNPDSVLPLWRIA